MIARSAASLALALFLIGCGARAELVYPSGSRGPATPQGAAQPPTPTKLTQPTVEARPERDDEALRQSEEREADPFDLPPEN
jgi:hypothetical protein